MNSIVHIENCIRVLIILTKNITPEDKTLKIKQLQHKKRILIRATLLQYRDTPETIELINGLKILDMNKIKNKTILDSLFRAVISAHEGRISLILEKSSSGLQQDCWKFLAYFALIVMDRIGKMLKQDAEEYYNRYLDKVIAI